jgi:hypothetical protein
VQSTFPGSWALILTALSNSFPSVRTCRSLPNSNALLQNTTRRILFRACDLHSCQKAVHRVQPFDRLVDFSVELQ